MADLQNAQTLRQPAMLPTISTDGAHKKPRNGNFELMRIVAACMVIFNHTFNQYYLNPNGSLYLPAIYVNLINVCAVGCFFMLTGYFLFKGNSGYFDKIKKTVFDLVLPTIVVLILIELTHAVAETLGKGALAFFAQFWGNLKRVAKEALAFGFTERRGYLWYVLDYIVVIIWYPLLKYICAKDKNADFTRRFLIALCVAAYIAYDIGQIFSLKFAINVPAIFRFNVLFVLLGYEVNRLVETEKYKKFKKGFGAAGILLYLVGVALAILFTYVAYVRKNFFNPYFTYLGNLTSIVSAFGLFVFFAGLGINNPQTQTAVRSLGKQTLYVYLLQSPFHVIIANIGLKNALFPRCGFYAFIVVGIVDTVASFGIAYLVNFIKDYAAKKINQREERLRQRYIPQNVVAGEKSENGTDKNSQDIVSPNMAQNDAVKSEKGEKDGTR